jgi:VWFA-related protein
MSGRGGTSSGFGEVSHLLLLIACLALFSLSSAPAQQSSGSGQTAPAGQQSPAAPGSENVEVNMHDSEIPLQSRVNVVPVRVIVRDAKGEPVANLHKEDFRLFEDGKLQDISHFLTETPASVAQALAHTEGAAGPGRTKPSANFVPPSRFVALLFDDVHISTPDLMRTRIAAMQFVSSAIQAADRVAVFTISGQSQMDFTADRQKLHNALLGLMVRPVGAGNSTGNGQCPPIDYYEANLIQNNLDPSALVVATEDTLACAYQNNPKFEQEAQLMATSAATEVYEEGHVETEASFRRLEEVLRRLSGLPGQRVLVLLSPGFIYPEYEYQLSQIIDHANRANVFINTLDARGLYTPDMGDISQQETGNPMAGGPRLMFREEAQTADSDVLRTLADGTGGLAFHNNNDLVGGLRMIAATPAVSYLLAFTPHNFKYDGKFHSLKVTLATNEHVTIEARRGFFAPKHSVSVEEAAKQEIEEALFSQDVQQAVPVEVHTQFYKLDAADAKLAVMTHVDLGHVRFQKMAGRNDDKLTIVTALFDADGNVVSATEKTVEMRLLDATLARLSSRGLTVKTSFDVKAGDYLVRLVVLDANADRLSTENDTVEIPF